MAASATGVRRGVAVLYVQFAAAVAAIEHPEVDVARALFVLAFLSVHRLVAFYGRPRALRTSAFATLKSAWNFGCMSSACATTVPEIQPASTSLG